MAADPSEALHERVRELYRAYPMRARQARVLVLLLPLAFAPAFAVRLAPLALLLHALVVRGVLRPFSAVAEVGREGVDLVAAQERERLRLKIRARILAAFQLSFAVGNAGAALLARAQVARLYFVGCAVVFGAWAVLARRRS